jgi:hypothetical protein
VGVVVNVYTQSKMVQNGSGMGRRGVDSQKMAENG